MKVLSLFSGVGGFEEGIKRAMPDAEFVGYSEIDKEANKVMRYHYGGTKNYGDVTKIKPEELPEFDMLCGGFPCQTFSIAGKRMGFKDPRGVLFLEIARIAEAKRPCILFLENVKGLLNHEEGKTFEAIIRTLDELGYDAEWQVLNSKNYGVPQNRERVFIIGYLREECAGEVFPIRGNYAKNNEPKGEIILDNKSSREMKRVYNPKGIAPTLHLKTGGWQETKISTTCIDAGTLRRGKWGNGEHKEQTGTLHSGSGRDFLVAATHIGNSKQFGNSQKEEQAFCLRASNPNGVIVKRTEECFDLEENQAIKDNKRVRRLTPRECEFLQSFPKDWTAIGLDSFLNLEAYYKVYGTKTQTNTLEILFILQEAIGKSQIEEWGLNESFSFLKNEILQPKLYERSIQREMAFGCIEAGRELQSEAINYCNRMFKLWEEKKLGYSSQRQEQIKQLFGKFDSALQKLPYKIAQEGRWMEQGINESEKEFFRQIHTLDRISDGNRYTMMGNAVTVNVIEVIAERIAAIKAYLGEEV